jgi:hypothetical protein
MNPPITETSYPESRDKPIFKGCHHHSQPPEFFARSGTVAVTERHSPPDAHGVAAAGGMAGAVAGDVANTSLFRKVAVPAIQYLVRGLIWTPYLSPAARRLSSIDF